MIKIPGQKKKKKRVEEESSFESGMTLIQGNLHKQATKVLSEALQKDPRQIGQKTLEAFLDNYQACQFENAVAIGEALQENGLGNSDFRVKMGNSYRNLFDTKKANHYYRLALKADRSNQLATYNLAASLAQVDLYDLDIIKSINLIANHEGPVLPGFLNDPDILEKVSTSLEEDKEQLRQKIETLIEEKETKSEAGDVKAVKDLIHAIETEERKLAISDYEATCKKLKQAFKKNWARQTIDETKKVLQENQFNLTLYAFSQGDKALVSDSLEKLNDETNSLANLDLLTALNHDLQGSTQEAIAALISILKQRPNDRYANANLGLLYKKTGNLLQAYRYLIKASDLLEKSEGLFDLDEVNKRADEYNSNGNISRAYQLYQMISEEQPNTDVFLRLGEIQIRQDQLLEATISFNEVKELDPNNSTAQERLKKIHELYYQRADTASRNGLYPEAVTLYQNALEIHKTADVINKVIRIYERQNDFSQVNSLKTELEKLKLAEAEKERENQRQMLIEKGKSLMKRKKFDKAIEILEKAFELKPDKDVFLLLAHLFKGLNQHRRLSSLMQQWRISKNRKEKQLTEGPPETF